MLDIKRQPGEIKLTLAASLVPRSPSDYSGDPLHLLGNKNLQIGQNEVIVEVCGLELPGVRLAECALDQSQTGVLVRVDGVLLVYNIHDGDDSFECIRRSIQRIRAFHSSSGRRYMLVGFGRSNDQRRGVTLEEVQRFAEEQDMPWFEVDSHHPSEVEMALSALAGDVLYHKKKKQIDGLEAAIFRPFDQGISRSGFFQAVSQVVERIFTPVAQIIKNHWPKLRPLYQEQITYLGSVLKGQNSATEKQKAHRELETLQKKIRDFLKTVADESGEAEISKHLPGCLEVLDQIRFALPIVLPEAKGIGGYPRLGGGLDPNRFESSVPKKPPLAAERLPALPLHSLASSYIELTKAKLRSAPKLRSIFDENDIGALVQLLGMEAWFGIMHRLGVEEASGMQNYQAIKELEIFVRENFENRVNPDRPLRGPAPFPYSMVKAFQGQLRLFLERYDLAEEAKAKKAAISDNKPQPDIGGSQPRILASSVPSELISSALPEFGGSSQKAALPVVAPLPWAPDPPARQPGISNGQPSSSAPGASSALFRGRVVSRDDGGSPSGAGGAKQNPGDDDNESDDEEALKAAITLSLQPLTPPP